MTYESRRDGDSADDSPGDGFDRRSVLRAVGGTGVTLGLAGCSGMESRSYEARPVSLSEDAADQGYSLRDRDTVETKREVEEGGTSIDVTLVSHGASYEREGDEFVDAATVGVISTPAVEVLGVTLNPVANEPLDELLTAEEGRAFLQQLGIEPSWQRGPEQLRTGTGTLFGTAVEFRTFAGVTATDEFVLLNLVRVEREDDAVLVGDARETAVDSTADPLVGDDGYVTTATVDESVESFADLLPAVVYGDDAAETGETARIDMDEVPDEFRQRAHLIIDQFSGDHPELWSRASLGDDAYRVSRPDVDSVAYYELAVEPEGYVVCATGPHDHPVPNFATEGHEIGRELESQADDTVATIVWFDRQRFVAENAAGEVVATRGNDVYRIESLAELAEYDDPIEVVAGPAEDGPVTDEDVTRGYEPTMRYVNDSEPPDDLPLPTLDDGSDDQVSRDELHDELPFEEWESHEELKESYAEAFGPLLADLRERAEDAWKGFEEHETQVQQGGISGTGSGQQYQTAGADMDVHSVFDSLLGTSPSGDKDWAGGWGEQVYYQQFAYGDCLVGCGPVAWAMLFGWADRQADDGMYEDTWWPRWGLYRENGGKGDDEKAPTAAGASDGDDQPPGVKNVIEEINDHVFTWCGGSKKNKDSDEIAGATHPAQMPFASRYFSGRTGTTMNTRYNAAGIPSVRMKWLARNSIRGDLDGMGPTPAVIGTGWLYHYPLAYAFNDGGWFGLDYFKVNNGYGNGSGNKSEWVWAPTWFAGVIDPNWD